jgi:hypothetical protein
MMPAASIFLEFQLPNATTWFYFSLILAVALFVKFRRFLSIRNWDVVSLFLLVPGLLLLQEARTREHQAQLQKDRGALPAAEAEAAKAQAEWLRWLGYLWLLAGSGYFLGRCLADLALVRRPALDPNLNPGGLAWLAAALFACLVSVAVRPPGGRSAEVGRKSVGMAEVERRVETTTNQVAGPGFDTHYWARRGLAIACHLAIAAGLVVVGWRHFQDVHGGMAAATCYLLLPYTALFVGQAHHVLPSALLVWAVVFYRRPVWAGVFLGLAAGAAYFPLLVFPLWLGFYWRRGAGRFAGAFVLAVGLSLAVVGLQLWLQGDLAASLRAAFDPDWQAWKAPRTEGFWQGIHWAYRFPVFIAYLAFVLGTAFWPAPKNLAHVLALSAAVVIGIQFWYADQGGVYVLWYLPLLLLLAFRPNLADRRPPPLAPEGDWLTAAGRWIGRRTLRLLTTPEPLARVR